MTNNTIISRRNILTMGLIGAAGLLQGCLSSATLAQFNSLPDFVPDILQPIQKSQANNTSKASSISPNTSSNSSKVASSSKTTSSSKATPSSTSKNTAKGNAKSSKIVQTAQSQIGTRYVLGGTSPSSGFDCSGLVWWTYKENGITVPRITKDQAYAGKTAPLNSLSPGDILVFSQKNAPNKLHTGLYLGNDKFIHSPNSKSRVREDSLTNNYWKSNLILARRIV